MNHDSGLHRDPAHIAGGRMSARCCLYMAMIVAIRCNPAIRPFYKHLRGQEKPPKVAIVAAMRKLLIAANAMLEHDRPWSLRRLTRNTVAELVEGRGFVFLSRRWVVERSFAWATCFRRLVKDYEHYGEALAELHVVAFACLMMKQAAALATGS